MDTTGLPLAKPRLRVEAKRDKRLSQSELERAARLAVKRRDGGKCVVPGCRERSVHLHHVVFRSQSKRLRWATGNLASLCRGHHAMVHAGRITISGDADDELIITGDKADLAFKL